MISILIASALFVSASGFNCSSQFDCNGSESCCGGVCMAGNDCLGHSCSINAHCKSEETCCNRICSQYCIQFTVDVIIASFLGLFIFSCTATLCFYFNCRPHKPAQSRYGRAILLPEEVTAKTFTTRCVTQGDSTYQTEAVPGYAPQYVEYTQYKYEEPSPFITCAVKPWKAGGMYLRKEEFAWFSNPSEKNF